MHADIDPSTIRPLKRVEFEALARQGAFDDERVELLYGVVVRMSPIGPAHNEDRKINTMLQFPDVTIAVGDVIR